MPEIPSPRILFILKDRNNAYACDPPYSTHLSSGLFNSARFVCNMLAEHGFVTKLVHVVDANAIHASVVEFRADIVIIEAFWVVPAKFDELKIVCPKVLFVVRNHSELPFLSSEGSAINWILEYVQQSNVIVACNSPKTLGEIRFLTQLQQPELSAAKVALKVAYLPNYYPTDKAFPIKRHSGNDLNIGCFGAVRPLKNMLIQAVAAMKYAVRAENKLTFHINGTRVEGNGDSILKNLIQLFEHFPAFSLVMHGWMPHHEFLTLVRQMDLVMQVSFSETFNIVAADAVVSGVPIVVSSEVPWASMSSKAPADDSDDISDKIATVLSRPSRDNLRGLEQYSVDSIVYWKACVAALFAMRS
jgi:hypothetical protein